MLETPNKLEMWMVYLPSPQWNAFQLQIALITDDLTREQCPHTSSTYVLFAFTRQGRYSPRVFTRIISAILRSIYINRNPEFLFGDLSNRIFLVVWSVPSNLNLPLLLCCIDCRLLYRQWKVARSTDSAVYCHIFSNFVI